MYRNGQCQKQKTMRRSLSIAIRAKALQTDSAEDNSEAVATVATVAVVGIGAAVFEAALLPGIVLGVAAMWLPRHFPQMEKR